MEQSQKPKRPRIKHGQVVASTNEAQNACARALIIIHSYNPLNYNRIRRFVYNT